MQTKKKILNFKFILGTFFAVSLLGSCAPVTSASDPTTNPTTNPTISSPTTNNTVTTNPTTEPSVSNPTIENPEGSINFDIYTINDFHGATQLSDDYYCEIGLPKMSTVFKQFARENTSFFLSSGDLWQGTIESNTNRGEYVTKAFNIMGLDATAIGNHEFDWGAEWITRNAEIADYPFLGANIKEKDTGYILEGLQPSTIIEKDGLKVGVIGTIGPAQYNTITYSYVVDYEFENEYNHVVSQAEYLRENGADVVILAAHDGYNSSDFGILKKDMIDEAKIDRVIAGHTHQKQADTYIRDDGQSVPLIQAYSSGTAFGHVNFTFDKETKELTLNTYAVENFNTYKNVEDDPEIVELYKNHFDVDDLKTEEICEAKTELSEKTVGIIAATAIYEKIRSMDAYKNYDIVAAFNNDGRSNIEKGMVNFEELFAALPFDNEIIIYEVSSNYINRSYYYTQTGFNKSISYTGKRYVAGIDYIAYKTIDLDNCIRTGLFVRDIAKEYLQNKKVVTSSDYTN